MKESAESSKNINTKEYNLNLINKYIIRSKKVSGCLIATQNPSTTQESDFTSSSESEESQESVEEFEEEEEESNATEDGVFNNICLYKNRRL